MKAITDWLIDWWSIILIVYSDIQIVLSIVMIFHEILSIIIECIVDVLLVRHIYMYIVYYKQMNGQNNFFDNIYWESDR